MGKAFIFGHSGLKRDVVEARAWLLKAAAQGMDEAQVIYADMLHKGMGGPENNKEALEWFVKAANHGRKDAQHNVGLFYLHGFGMGKADVEEAKLWFERSARQGHKAAIAKLEQVGYMSCNNISPA